MTDLKSCPWQEPEWPHHLLDIQFRCPSAHSDNAREYVARVYCRTCGCMGPERRSHDQDDAVDRAKWVWNNRKEAEYD